MTSRDRSQPVQVNLHDIIALHLYFNWAQNTIGFGQLDVNVQLRKEDGGAAMRITGDSETMGREWIRAALHALADTVANAIPEDGLELGKPVDVPIPSEVLKDWAELHQLLSGEGEPSQPADPT